MIRFGSKNSFLDHINRRGLIITYKCNKCSARLKLRFYNPCAFLLHCHKHFINNEFYVNLENVKIETLPIGMAGFLPHPNVPLLYNGKEVLYEKESIANAVFYVPLSTNMGDQFVYFKPTTLQFQTNNQPDKWLELKLLSSNTPHCIFTVKNPLKQAKNNLKMLNRSNDNCVLEDADQNEIGRDNHDVQNINLTNVVDLRKCSECGCSVVNLPSHFVGNDVPTNENLKCVICNYIAATECSLKAHERIHSEEEPYVCPECGANFKDFKILVSHANNVCFHLPKQVRYKCLAKNCNKTFGSVLTYKSHFIVHTSFKYRCPTCLEIYTSVEEAISHEKIHNFDVTTNKYPVCSICNEELEKEFLSHVDAHVSSYKCFLYGYICKYCRSYFKSRKTYAIHITKCHKKNDNDAAGHEINTFIERQCQYCGTVYKLAYSNHTLIACPSCVEYSERICILCKDVIHYDKFKEHLIKQCPYRNPMIKMQKLSPEIINKYVKDDDQDELINIKKRKKRFNFLNKNKKFVHKRIAKDNQFVDPVPFTGTYNCSLCNFSHEIRNEFHKHIAQHRTVSTAYQCMECGECFVVKPSLAKHLLHFHQIKDIELYLNENKCCDEKAIEDLNNAIIFGSSNTPIKENQCRVCFKEFDEQIELKKHFRVHGMAFLLYNSK